MTLLQLGVHVRLPDTSLLAGAAVCADEVDKTLVELVSYDGIQEVVLLATCNRVEVYAEVDAFHVAHERLLQWLQERCRVDRATLDGAHEVRFGDHVARHLFRVAAGLESLVPGEREILGQVRAAVRTAREQDTCRTSLGTLFDDAIRAARAVRADGALDGSAGGMVELALDAVRQHSAAAPRCLVLGAGSMGSAVAAGLVDLDGATVQVANRTREHAEHLADQIGASVVADLASAIRDADVIVTATGSPEHLVTADAVEGSCVVIDLALPHNVSPSVAELDGVILLDVVGLREIAARTIAVEALLAAEATVEHHVQAWAGRRRAAQVVPVITALRARAEDVLRDELETARTRLDGLDEAEQDEVRRLLDRVVNKLLHTPTVRLKELAARDLAGAHATALDEVFALGALTRPDAV